MTARGKTTPNSTPGSFRPHAGTKSRAEAESDAVKRCEACEEPVAASDIQNRQCNSCRDAAQDAIMSDVNTPEPDDEWEGIPMYLPNGIPASRSDAKSRACWFEGEVCDVAVNDGRVVRVEAEYLHAGGWLSGRPVGSADPGDRENIPLTDITSITIV